MPTFDTPRPIVATIHMAGGSVRVNASTRTDTVVEVRPSHEGSGADVQAATLTRVEYAGGRLLVKAPKSKVRSLFGMGPSVDITIDLPEGSELNASGWADVDCTGQLGKTQIDTASGDIRVDHTGALRAKTASGDITAVRVQGHADASTMSGDIHIGDLDGSAAIQTASGNLSVGEVTGALRLNTASGDITVDRALASVTARTASGSVRVCEVVSGSVVLQTAGGDLEIGIREGTAAWLDVNSMSGAVHSSLQASEGPGGADQTVEIRARTLSGDIVVHRA